MDYYLKDENAVARLLEEWKKYKKIIIAYDFDDTVYDFYKKGRKYESIIDLLKRCEKVGAYFIVFTCREEKHFPEVAKYLIENSIPYDKINDNISFIAEQMTSRKIYYNIFLDDRAGLSASYNILKSAVESMEYEMNF
jgi:hypothetical protein